MSAQNHVLTSIENEVFTITIQHGRFNSLDLPALAALEAAVDQFFADLTLKAVVIASANPAVWVSGADITAFANPDSAELLSQAIRKGQNLFHRIHQSHRPFIAAINGLALGGGFELALACHIRVAAERARLGCPEVSLGILPAWGGTQYLARLLGSAKALEIILLAEPFSAQEALRLNLVSKVVPRAEVLPAAREYAEKIAAHSGRAVQAAMRAVLAAEELSLADGLAREIVEIETLLATEEDREEVRGYIHRRQAPG